MKKILIYNYILLLLAVSFSACKKTIDKDYLNPELSTKPIISGFFTEMLNSDRVRPAYWNLRTFFFPQISVYAQTTSFDNAGQAYQPNDGYIGEYWSDFYFPSSNGSGPMATYRAMQAAYTGLPSADQASQQVFMEAAKVVLDERAAKMVDMWGDIPFSQAGNLETASSIKNPVFDDQKTLYYSFISDLNEAATYFGSVKLTGNVQSAFSKADILNSGSLLKWQEYANSVRLRLLMRISNYDETTAKAAVTTMLSNPTSYPLVDGGNPTTGNYNPGSSDILIPALTTNTSSTLYSALTEIDSYWAPDYKLNKVMNPSNDPRIPVMFDKYGKTVNGVFVPNKTYRAMPESYGVAQQDTAFANYSIVDSTTFLNNVKMPGIVITASEVNFLKAEAYERWGSEDNAKTAYNTALAESVYFYFYLNNLGGGTATPSDADITTFLANTNVAYNGTTQQKLALIYTQKWVHFGFLQSDEAWAELRRTKYPLLTFPPQTQVGHQLPPTRLPYPSVETSYNTNYNKVKSKDTPTTKIFWDVN